MPTASPTVPTAEALAINRFNEPVPVGGTYRDFHKPELVRYLTAPYRAHRDAPVTAVAVFSMGDVRIYPLPGAKPPAGFNGKPYRKIGASKLPMCVHMEFQTHLDFGTGYRVSDTPDRDKRHAWQWASRLYDLPLRLVRVDHSTMLVPKPDTESVAWQVAEAFRRLGITAPLHLLRELTRDDTPPPRTIDAEAARQIHDGLLHGVQAALDTLLTARSRLDDPTR